MGIGIAGQNWPAPVRQVRDDSDPPKSTPDRLPGWESGEEWEGGVASTLEEPPMIPRRLSAATLATLVFAAFWIAVLALPPVVLMRSRAVWLERLEKPEAQHDWDQFRDAMRQQTGRQGPVQRKVPKSPEPPLRVWLRDYVWLAIAAWLVLGGVLGGFTAMLVRGALLAKNHPGRCDDDEKQDRRNSEHAKIGKHGN
jgi:hypothetical protein